MKRLVLPLILIMSAGSADAMFSRKGGAPKAAAPQLVKSTPDEISLIATLNLGDVEALKKLIAEKRIDVNEPLKLESYQGKTPLEIIFEYQMPNKLQIAQVLLDAGAIDADGKAKAAIDAAKGNLARIQELAKNAYEKALAALGAKTEGASEAVVQEQASAEQTEPIAASAQEQEPLKVEFEGEKIERIAPVVITPMTHYPTKFKQLVPRQEQPEVAKEPLLSPTEKPTPAQQPAVKQRVSMVPVSKPAPAQAQVPVAKAPAVPVKPASVKPAPVAPRVQTAKPRVQEVKVEITPVIKPKAKPLVLGPQVKPAPAKQSAAPASARTQAPEVKASALPVNPTPAKAKWPSRPAPMRPVQQVPVSVLEEQGVPTAKPVEELQIMGTR